MLTSTWHSNRKSFTLSELQKLLGKVARLGMACNWVYHLLSHLYQSTAFVISKNTEHLENNSKNFREHMKRIKELRRSQATIESHENIARINFHLKKGARMIYAVEEKYFINKDMKAEIDFLRQVTDPDSGLEWTSPIAHKIPRNPNWKSWSDSCLSAGGGYSIEMRFVWYLIWSQEIYKRTLACIAANSELLISINVLEFYSVIINYCAALTVIAGDPNFTDDPWPVLLAWCDNTSAVRWIRHACLKSAAGRALGRFFCMLLIDERLGINSKWISTHDNFIADEISRIREAWLKTNSPDHPLTPHPPVDFQSILQKHPDLQKCQRFVPSSELLSVLDTCVLKGCCPSLEDVKTLKQRGLGKLISLDL